MTLVTAQEQHRKRVVLCIDDDWQMLGVLDAFLRQSGYEVLTASSPESTLVQLLNNHVDAVVTDYELGQFTSKDVILSLQSLRPGIPIVLFSGAEDIPPTVTGLINGQIHKTEITSLPAELDRVLGSEELDSEAPR